MQLCSIMYGIAIVPMHFHYIHDVLSSSKWDGRAFRWDHLEFCATSFLIISLLYSGKHRLLELQFSQIIYRNSLKNTAAIVFTM